MWGRIARGGGGATANFKVLDPGENGPIIGPMKKKASIRDPASLLDTVVGVACRTREKRRFQRIARKLDISASAWARTELLKAADVAEGRAA